MTLIGYMRVSTDDQDTDMQKEALLRAGVAEADIYSDTMSGKVRERPGLERALARVQAGDTLVVWKLDRLGRGMMHLVEMVEGLVSRGATFRSITEAWDTSTPMGKAMFRIGCVFSELEREIITERVRAGVREKMRQDGVWGRRSSVPYDAARVAELRRLGHSTHTIAMQLGISASTVGRVLRRGQRSA